MKTFGAVYVVYENSGYLAESVLRIYPLVKKIVFLVGFEPWYGRGDPAFPQATMKTIYEMYDPDNKFVVIGKKWPSEHAQRNEGLRVLHDLGCDWCLIIDDDEMYNRMELDDAMRRISSATYANGEAAAFLVWWIIYWRDRQTAIEGLIGPMPTFVRTKPGSVIFTNARNFSVLEGIYSDMSSDVVVCHHVSYVREPSQMRRKFSWFSHAPDVKEEWIDKVWLGWTPEMENLHPMNPSSFKKAVPAETLQWQLEPMPGRLPRRK